MIKQQVGKSKEDYLEAILVLTNELGACRVTDIAVHLGYSNPSASVAVAKLEEEGFVTRDDWRIILTEKGKAIAQNMLDKHSFFKEWFIKVGIDEETAVNEACLLEHAISDDSFKKISDYLRRVESDI